MDLDSINGGTVDNKSYLNPVVGTLRAKKIYCDDIEGSGGVPTVANLGWTRTGSPSQLTQITAGENGKSFLTGASTPDASIPDAELSVGSSWEVYNSGVVQNNTATLGRLQMGITLDGGLIAPIDSLYNLAGKLDYENSDTANAYYEYRCAFRVLAIDPILQTRDLSVTSTLSTFRFGMGITAEQKYVTGSAELIQVWYYLPTPSTCICAPAMRILSSADSDFNITQHVSYVRRIA